ncbi:hypothetical protein Tco_1307349 [Tanacetum coccineum]
MASFDYRYAIKECSSCGALYTRNRGCSKGSLEDKILVPVPDSSQRPLIFENFYLNYGDPVHGLYFRQCALIRKTLEEIFQDFQDTSESSDDDTNFVNENQEPFVVDQDPGKNSSQSPPLIDHHCCYECGDSLKDIFCHRCTCEFCGNGAHIGYNCPPMKVSIISKPEPCNNQTVNELPQTLPSVHPTCYSGDENSFTYDSKPNFIDDSPNVFNLPPQPLTYSYEFCRNDAYYDLIESALNSKLLSIKSKSQRLVQEQQEVKNIAEPAAKRRTCITSCLQNFKVIHKESTIPLSKTPQISPVIAITPDLPTEEPEYSLSMGDEHLSTILETESDEVIKSSVENLVPIPSESEVTSDNESECDFDYLLEEFSGELAQINPIPPGIKEADFDIEEEIRLVKNLSYGNSSPRPPEELNVEIADLILESLSPSLILVEDSDSHMEEIDLFLATDDSMLPGIENDDYESEGDILFLEELLSNDPLPLPEIESSNLDHFNDPSSPRPPP